MKNLTTTASARTIRIGLSDNLTSKDFIPKTDGEVRQELEAFDPVYVVRSIVDIVPNPWRARQIVAEAVALLTATGLDNEVLGQRQPIELIPLSPKTQFNAACSIVILTD